QVRRYDRVEGDETQDPAVDLEYAADDFAGRGASRFRGGLQPAGIDVDEVADPVDQQAGEAIADLHDDDDRGRGGFSDLQAQAGAQIDDRNDQATQIAHTLHIG